jgi:uncharacterized protein (TIRG00374 family)
VTRSGTARGGRSIALASLGVVLSVVAAWLAVRDVDLAAVGVILARVEPIALLPIGAVLVAQIVVRAMRWSVVLTEGSVARPPVGRLVPILLVGYLGNAVLPARLGDAGRALLLVRREGQAPGNALGSVLLERVIDLTTLGVMGAAAAIVVGRMQAVAVAAGTAVVIGAIVLALAQTSLPRRLLGAMGRFRHWLVVQTLAHVERLLHQFSARGRRAIFVIAFGFTVVVWVLETMTYSLAGRAVGLAILPTEALLIAAAAVFSTAIPSAPGYVGTFELAASGAARALGVDPESALAMAVFVHAVTVIPLAIAGAACLAWFGLGAGPRTAADRPDESPT